MNAVSKICIGLVMASLPLTAGCMQFGRYNQGQVKQVGELPCFSVDDSREAKKGKPELAVLTVYHIKKDKPPERVWEVGFVTADPPVRLSPDDCIVYGDNSRGDKEGAMDAMPLRTGVAYSYSFNSHIPYTSIIGGSGWKYRSYSGHFCLTQDAGGRITVHDVRWDEKEKLWLWKVCNLVDAAEVSGL
jgi:hypothetical protein